MTPAHSHLCGATDPRPVTTLICSACEAETRLAPHQAAPGWTFETIDHGNHAYCPDCSIGRQEAADALFEPSLYAEGLPMEAVVYSKGRWFGLAHIVSGRVLAHQFGEFGFWRMKGAAQ